MATSLASIVLPNDIRWLDPFTSKVAQQYKVALDGTPIVTAFPREKGLPISLQSWPNGAFLAHETVMQIQAIAEIPGVAGQLILRDVEYNVMFRHHEGQAFQAEPVKDVANPGQTDWYRVTINLMTV